MQDIREKSHQRDAIKAKKAPEPIITLMKYKCYYNTVSYLTYRRFSYFPCRCPIPIKLFNTFFFSFHPGVELEIAKRLSPY